MKHCVEYVKMILGTEKLKMQKWAVFHLISKHSLNIDSFVYSLWIIDAEVKNER